MSELENGFRIGDVIGLVRRRLAIVVAAAVIGAIAGFLLFSSAPTVYGATARVEVKGVSTDPTVKSAPLPNMATQQDLVKQDAVTEAVIAKLKLPGDARSVRNKITAVFKEGSEVLEITYTADTAAQARDGANAVAEAYVTVRTASVTADVDAARTDLAAQQSDLQGEVKVLRAEVDALEQGTPEYIEARDVWSAANTDLTEVEEQIDALPRITGTTAAEIATKATTPAAVTSKMALGKGVGAFGLFVVAGLAVAWALDRRDGLGGGRRRVEQLLPGATFRVMPNADGRNASPAEVDTAIDRLAVELVAGGGPGRATSVLVIGAGHEPPVALAEELASSLAFAGIPALFVLAGSSDRELRQAQVITSFADLLQGASVTGPAGLPETAGAISTSSGPIVTWLRPRGSAESSGLLRRAVVEALVTRAGREKFEAVVFVAPSPSRTAAGTALGQWVHRTAVIVAPDERSQAEDVAQALASADVKVSEVVWT